MVLIVLAKVRRLELVCNRVEPLDVEGEDHEREFVLLELAQLRLRDVHKLSRLRLTPERGSDDRSPRRDIGLDVRDHGEAWAAWHAHSPLQHVHHESVREVVVIEAVVEDALAVAFEPVVATRVGMNVELDVSRIGVDVDNLDLEVEAVVLANGVFSHVSIVASGSALDLVADRQPGWAE
jgi:hypothetical protein